MSADEHEKPTVDSLGVEGQFVGEVDEQPRPVFREPDDANLVGLIDVYKFLVGDPPGAGSSPDPIATAPTTAVPPPPTESWTDTFADDRIGPARWALNSRPELIYERGGVLNLEVPRPPRRSATPMAATRTSSPCPKADRSPSSHSP